MARPQRARSHLGPAASPEEVEAWREEIRDSLRPSLKRALLGPFAALLVLAGGLVVYRAIGEVGMVLLFAGLFMLAALRFRGRKIYPVSRATVVREYEESLDRPGLHRWLGKAERAAFVVLAFVCTPAIGRLLLGDFRGEVGFGGIIILLAALFIALFAALFVAFFQSDYMQDRYGPRLAIDAAVIAFAYLLVTGQAPIIAGPTPPLATPVAEPAPPGPTEFLLQEVEAARSDAARLGRVEELLAQGAKPDATNRAGDTALMAAVRGARAGDDAGEARLALARLLLDRGANIHARDASLQPVVMLALDDPALFGFLVARGADPTVVPFWREMEKRPPDEVIALAERMPAVRADPWGGPYCMAMRNPDPLQRARLIAYFGRRGVPPGAERCEWGTPLATAIGMSHTPGDVALIDQLLAAGASLEERDPRGETPLMRAGYAPELVRHLIGKGAALDALSASGETALDLYEARFHRESAEILAAAGGKRAIELPVPAR